MTREDIDTHLANYQRFIGTGNVRASGAIVPVVLEALFGLVTELRAEVRDLQDQLVIKNVIDTPVRRVFSIDVGDLSVEEARSQIDEIKAEIAAKSDTGCGGACGGNCQCPEDGSVDVAEKLADEQQIAVIDGVAAEGEDVTSLKAIRTAPVVVDGAEADGVDETKKDTKATKKAPATTVVEGGETAEVVKKPAAKKA